MTKSFLTLSVVHEIVQERQRFVFPSFLTVSSSFLLQKESSLHKRCSEIVDNLS